MGVRVRQAKARVEASSSILQAFRKTWRHREPVMWAAIVALVLTVQWPTLKGWYYGETGAAVPASGIAWAAIWPPR
jgi:hypothetical protein